MDNVDYVILVVFAVVVGVPLWVVYKEFFGRNRGY
jgi:hypothetical protein